MPNSEPFRNLNLPPMSNMDATVDSSPPSAASDPGQDGKTPLLIRTHLPSSSIEAFGIIGGYQLIEKLGEGGMGTVYMAEDVSLKRRVAVKVMKPNMAVEPISRDRFFREARAAAALEHDNIVAIHQVSEENGVPYLVMPLLKGESLGGYLTRQPRPSLEFILKVGRDVALGLAAAHTQGLVHRDIKPDNIWIEPIPGEGSNFRAKILDFGLARPRQEDGALLTRQGAFLGTPAYVAPEQARGMEVDQRADLFSLGCVMYEMTAGRRPFAGVDTMAVLTSLISEHPHEPRSFNPDVPPALSMLIMQLLEKDAGKRPNNAVIVADLLKQVQAALAGGASPSTIGRRLEEPVAAWQPEEPRSVLPWFLLGLLVLFGAGGYAIYKYKPPPGPGTVEISAEANDANVRYSGSSGLKIEDETGKIIKKIASERKFILPVGKYKAEIEGVSSGGPGLELKVEEAGNAGISKKSVDFKVEPGATVKLKVVLVKDNKFINDKDPPKKDRN
jgi:serine/threonine protein kinase